MSHSRDINESYMRILKYYKIIDSVGPCVIHFTMVVFLRGDYNTYKNIFVG